jgi:hypothetical protein
VRHAQRLRGGAHLPTRKVSCLVHNDIGGRLGGERRQLAGPLVTEPPEDRDHVAAQQLDVSGAGHLRKGRASAEHLRHTRADLPQRQASTIHLAREVRSGGDDDLAPCLNRCVDQRQHRHEVPEERRASEQQAHRDPPKEDVSAPSIVPDSRLGSVHRWLDARITTIWNKVRHTAAGRHEADRSWRCALLKSGTSAAFVAS